jgi:hypothetical protein
MRLRISSYPAAVYLCSRTVVASRKQILDAPRVVENFLFARSVNPVEGKDEKNGSKRSEQQIG